jgi:hypothetical protein
MRSGRAPGLATNGGALMANVVVAGGSGLLFWIIAAQGASPSAVAQASALITGMFGVLQIAIQMLSMNVPIMVTASPRPGWILGYAYLTATILIGIGAVVYALVAPRVASGLDFLLDPSVAVLFVLGCILWGFFSLQDSALSGIVKGHLVLVENAVWGVLRIALFVLIAVTVGTITASWILLTWLIPALFLVLVVNWYLYASRSRPMRIARGTKTRSPRSLIGHMGWETVTAFGNGGVNLVLPAIVLTAVGSDAAAPFFAAYSFVLVGENALGAFTSAYSVELSRDGERSTNHLRALGHRLMGLLGEDYRETGGTVLIILSLGFPFRSMTLLSASVNRVAGRAWRNAAQQVTYVIVAFGFMAIFRSDSVNEFAIALVLGRMAAAAVAVWHLRGGPGNLAGAEQSYAAAPS